MNNVLITLFKLTIGLFFSLSPTVAHTDSTVISFEALYFEDLDSTSTIEDVRHNKADVRFKTPNKNGLSFGWVDHPYWIKINIHPLPKKQVLYLEIPWPLLDELSIYLFDTNKQLVDSYTLGDHQAFSNRPIFDAHFVIPIDFSQHDITEIYFFVRTTSSMQLPIEFWSEEAYLKHRAIHLTVQGVFYGLLLVMIFYNFFIYLSSRRVAYLHYVCFVLSFGILQLGLKGTGFQFIWPQTPLFNDYAIATGGSFSLLFLALFARSFLQLVKTPTLKKINNVMVAVGLLFIFASFVLPYRTIITPLTVTVLISAVIVIVKAVIRYRSGFREARFYLLAWASMVAGCFVYLSKQLGLLPVNSFTENSLQIGSAIEILLLSFALADRLGTLQVRLRSANEKLEQEVDERTKELVLAMEKLGSANSKLSLISTTDGLTGLRNRYHFDAALEREISKAQLGATKVALLLLDIDHFKGINDKWGHVVGDRALQFVSGCLRSKNKRQADTVCRYGGEEFAIILPDAGAESAGRFAESIRLMIEKNKFYEGDKHIPITISIGVCATAIASPVDSATLIKAADIALYKAKGNGRNCVYIFKGQLDGVALDKVDGCEQTYRIPESPE